MKSWQNVFYKCFWQKKNSTPSIFFLTVYWLNLFDLVNNTVSVIIINYLYDKLFVFLFFITYLVYYCYIFSSPTAWR